MGQDERKLGILVVGTGFLGAERAAAAGVARGVRLAAVYDRDPASARATAARHGVVVAPDLATGLDFPGVDAVVVATPHADHVEAVRAAPLEAGKHVLCEKPLTVDPADARELARLADARRLRLATGLNHRFYPPVADALALVAGGAIGRVEGVRAEIGHRASPGFLAGWHGDPSRSGGGTLMDNGPHACDLLRRLLVEVVSAQGCLREPIGGPPGCEMEAFALFRSHDRAVAESVELALEEGYLSLNIRGDAGHLRVETAPWRLSGRLAGGRRLRRAYLTGRVAERLFRLWAGCERSLVHELEDFAEMSGNRPRAGASGWDGCRVAEMVEAVYRSAADRREIGLDPLPVRLPGGRRRVVGSTRESGGGI